MNDIDLFKVGSIVEGEIDLVALGAEEIRGLIHLDRVTADDLSSIMPVLDQDSQHGRSRLGTHAFQRSRSRPFERAPLLRDELVVGGA